MTLLLMLFLLSLLSPSVQQTGSNDIPQTASAAYNGPHVSAGLREPFGPGGEEASYARLASNPPPKVGMAPGRSGNAPKHAHSGGVSVGGQEEEEEKSVHQHHIAMLFARRSMLFALLLTLLLIQCLCRSATPRPRSFSLAR